MLNKNLLTQSVTPVDWHNSRAVLQKHCTLFSKDLGKQNVNSFYGWICTLFL